MKIKSWAVVGVDELEGESWSTEDGAWAALGRHCMGAGWVDTQDWCVVGRETADGPDEDEPTDEHARQYAAGQAFGRAVAALAASMTAWAEGVRAGQAERTGS